MAGCRRKYTGAGCLAPGSTPRLCPPYPYPSSPTQGSGLPAFLFLLNIAACILGLYFWEIKHISNIVEETKASSQVFILHPPPSIPNYTKDKTKLLYPELQFYASHKDMQMMGKEKIIIVGVNASLWTGILSYSCLLMKARKGSDVTANIQPS